MDVYLLRHGDAGPHWSEHDDQRPLTPEGITRIKRQAATLRSWGIKVDMLISSPYVRARQTADVIAKAFDVTAIEDARLSAGCILRDVLALLHEHTASKHIWLTGHEPDLSTIASGLIRGGQIKMAKGGLARVHITSLQPANGELIWHLTPQTMGADE